jgi:hypothetical protein
MRSFGAVLFLAGAVGFLVASQRLDEAGPVPARLGVEETLEHPAGRYDLMRYGAATAAVVGLILALFPKGR